MAQHRYRYSQQSPLRACWRCGKRSKSSGLLLLKLCSTLHLHHANYPRVCHSRHGSIQCARHCDSSTQFREPGQHLYLSYLRRTFAAILPIQNKHLSADFRSSKYVATRPLLFYRQSILHRQSMNHSASSAKSIPFAVPLFEAPTPGAKPQHAALLITRTHNCLHNSCVGLCTVTTPRSVLLHPLLLHRQPRTPRLPLRIKTRVTYPTFLHVL